MHLHLRSVLTTEAYTREFTADLEVRASGDGRTITGIVVPFEREARVSDGGPSYMEMFRRGAFTKTIAERGSRVKFLSQHDQRRNPLGRATLLREDATGVYGEFQVSKTSAGDEALELVRDGALDSFSVGFAPVKHLKEGDTVVRTEVSLREVSLVTFPAYEDARIAAVRHLSPDELAELAEYVRDHIDLSATPTEPAESGTPIGAAPSESEPPVEALRGLTPQQRLTIVRAAFATRSAA